MNSIWYGESLSAYAFLTGITVLKVSFACLFSYDHDVLLPEWFSKGISAKSYWSCAPGGAVFTQSCQPVQKEFVLRLNSRSSKISYLVVAGLGIMAVPVFSKKIPSTVWKMKWWQKEIDAPYERQQGSLGDRDGYAKIQCFKRCFWKNMYKTCIHYRFTFVMLT